MSTLAKLLMGVSGAKSVPPTPGIPYEGGYYAGRIMIDGQAYALVVAPKAQGEASLQWKSPISLTTGTYNTADGWANTQAMLLDGSASHPAAAFCAGLNINGYDDWYFPARDELEIIYRAFKPTTQDNRTDIPSGGNSHSIPPGYVYTTSLPSQTNVEVFKQGGEEAFEGSNYWSSSQSNASSAYLQNFANGYQRTYTKSQGARVRAVRRVAI